MKYNNTENEPNICMRLIEYTIYSGYILWGIYELYGVSCSELLHDTLLWKISFVSVIISLSLYSILVIGAIVVMIFSFIKYNNVSDFDTNYTIYI